MNDETAVSTNGSTAKQSPKAIQDKEEIVIGHEEWWNHCQHRLTINHSTAKQSPKAIQDKEEIVIGHEEWWNSCQHRLTINRSTAKLLAPRKYRTKMKSKGRLQILVALEFKVSGTLVGEKKKKNYAKSEDCRCELNQELCVCMCVVYV